MILLLYKFTFFLLTDANLILVDATLEGIVIVYVLLLQPMHMNVISMEFTSNGEHLKYAVRINLFAFINKI